MDALLYPPLCPLCRQPYRDGLCGSCPEFSGEDLPRCYLCALELAEALRSEPSVERRCAACRTSAPPFSGAVCIGGYAAHADDSFGPLDHADGGHAKLLRDWVLALKHGERPDLARPLGWHLAQRVRAWSLPPGTRVTSVPLHPARRLERGYDQAALLGRSLAETLGLSFERALSRSRATLPQGSASSPGRRENVRGAFVARQRRRAKGSTWILVDDVGTSLATAREAAWALGAPRTSTVYLALVARAELRQRAEALRGDWPGPIT